MGTWNTGIKSDDFVLDIIDSFNNYLKNNKSISESTDLILKEYADEIKDTDEGPLFWIALGEIQWTYGELDLMVLEKIKDDYSNNRGLSHWEEQSNKVLLNRKKVIDKFIQKLGSKNTNPRKRPKLRIRPPIYRAGDCISVILTNHLYGAALVLTAKHNIEELGINTIALLDYMSELKPNIEVFQKREWLKLTHHNWKGKRDICDYSFVHWKKERYRFEVIGNIMILPSDPKEGFFFTSYTSLGKQIVLQKEWLKSANNGIKPTA